MDGRAKSHSPTGTASIKAHRRRSNTVPTNFRLSVSYSQPLNLDTQAANSTSTVAGHTRQSPSFDVPATGSTTPTPCAELPAISSEAQGPSSSDRPERSRTQIGRSNTRTKFTTQAMAAGIDPEEPWKLPYEGWQPHHEKKGSTKGYMSRMEEANKRKWTTTATAKAQKRTRSELIGSGSHRDPDATAPAPQLASRSSTPTDLIKQPPALPWEACKSSSGSPSAHIEMDELDIRGRSRSRIDSDATLREEPKQSRNDGFNRRASLKWQAIDRPIPTDTAKESPNGEQADKTGLSKQLEIPRQAQEVEQAGKGSRQVSEASGTQGSRDQSRPRSVVTTQPHRVQSPTASPRQSAVQVTAPGSNSPDNPFTECCCVECCAWCHEECVWIFAKNKPETPRHSRSLPGCGHVCDDCGVVPGNSCVKWLGFVLQQCLQTLYEIHAGCIGVI